MRCEQELLSNISFVPFGDLLLEPLRNGLTKPKAVRGDGVKMIGMGEIFANSRIGAISMSRVPVTEKELSKNCIKNGDILFARQSLALEGAGKCSIVIDVTEETVFESHLIRARIDSSKANPYFVYYYFNSYVGKEHIKTIVEQVAAAGIRGSDLVRLKVPCPDLETQERIAAILSALDEKIAINRAINDNLYHLLSLSFKNDYWDKAIDHPEWIMTTLDETTSRFGTGLNPRKNFVLGHGNNYYVTIKNMGNNRIYLDERCDKIDDEVIRRIQMRSDLKVGDLLFSGIGTIGRVFLIDKPATNWNTSESVFNLRPNAKVSSEFLYLLLLNNDMQDYAISLASGSVQKGIRMADLKKYSFFLPTSDVIKRLTSLWKPLIKQIKANEVESDSLAVLRDTLLPKLMSGEIDVSAVQL